jgi:hypothetical protein
MTKYGGFALKYYFCIAKMDQNIGSQENRQFFGKTLQKSPKIMILHNIDPRRTSASARASLQRRS